SYARTMQAQRYMREQQEAQLRHGLQAKAAFMASEPFRKAFYLYATWQGGESAAKAMASMFEGTPLAAAGNTAAAAAAEFKNQQRNRMMAAQQATVELARYNYSTSAHAFWTSESAVAARWYTHDTSLGFPGEQLMGMHIVNGYLNQEAMMKAGVDETTKQVMGTGDQFMNWWQSRGMVPGGPARP
ncbi:MAG TPA: hypothetical protein PLP17_16850, partial [Oligoflexia bacterium]|nr:hypothetical protein [Oligoflexia bacterium]